MKTQAFAAVVALFAMNASSCIASESRYDSGLETVPLATAADFVNTARSDRAPPQALDVRGDATGTANRSFPGPTILVARLGTDRIPCKAVMNGTKGLSERLERLASSAPKALRSGVAPLDRLPENQLRASEGKYDSGLETGPLATATDFVNTARSDRAPPQALDVRGDAPRMANRPFPGPILLARLGTDRI